GGGVGQVLALPGNRQGEEPRDDRGQDQREEPENQNDERQPTTLLDPAPAPPSDDPHTSPTHHPSRAVRDQGDHPDQRGEQGQELGVLIPAVSQVGQRTPLAPFRQPYHAMPTPMSVAKMPNHGKTWWYSRGGRSLV